MSCRHQGRFVLVHPNAGTGDLFQLCKPTGVVGVAVSHHYVRNLLGSPAELSDSLQYPWRTLTNAGVDQGETLGLHDEVCAHKAQADPVHMLSHCLDHGFLLLSYPMASVINSRFQTS